MFVPRMNVALAHHLASKRAGTTVALPRATGFDSRAGSAAERIGSLARIHKMVRVGRF
jgi:hypothetical protein